MGELALIFETIMLVLFGISWPINILKSFRAKTAKGKSVMFLIIIWVGYLCGVCAKFLGGNITYVVWIYFINIAMVSVDIILYFRNRRLDKMREITELSAAKSV